MTCHDTLDTFDDVKSWWDNQAKIHYDVRRLGFSGFKKIRKSNQNRKMGIWNVHVPMHTICRHIYYEL